MAERMRVPEADRRTNGECGEQKWKEGADANVRESVRAGKETTMKKKKGKLNAEREYSSAETFVDKQNSRKANT